MKYLTEVYIESAVAIHGEKTPKEEPITNTASQESIDMCKHILQAPFYYSDSLFLQIMMELLHTRWQQSNKKNSC